MRVAVECKSPLLQKSLELFLSKHLSSLRQCDILIRDTPCINDKRCFYISTSKDADLIKPFSSSQLILALEKRYTTTTKKKIQDIDPDYFEDGLDFTILEKRINSLTKEYERNIIKAVRAFYEK